MIEIDRQYVNNAIEEVFDMLGAKEDISCSPLRKLMKQSKIKECVESIADYLGLPIRANLSYVPANYSAINHDGANSASSFTSQQLVKTDRTGRGVEAITAQVLIPNDLPLFGTAGLKDFPIQILVSENVKEYPNAFIAIMAHEFCHVLLNSLRFRKSDNEVYTDLTAMLLGFNKVMKQGRTTVKQENMGFTIFTTTTTYGYLSEEQFNFASNKITKILKENRKIKKDLDKQCCVLQKEFDFLQKGIYDFRQNLALLDEKAPQKITGRDGQKIISFHAPGYLDNFEVLVKDIKEQIQCYCKCKPLNHYYNLAVVPKEKIAILRNKIKEKKSLLINNLKILKKTI